VAFFGVTLSSYQHQIWVGLYLGMFGPKNKQKIKIFANLSPQWGYLLWPISVKFGMAEGTLADVNYTVSQKKFPPLNALQLCQILTDFQNFCTAEKHMKFATKPI